MYRRFCGRRGYRRDGRARFLPTERSRRARFRISERNSRLVEFRMLSSFALIHACCDPHACQPRSIKTAQTSRTLAALEHHGCGELFEPKETKCPLTIEIENTKIVGFMQILHGNPEMAAIPLLRHRPARRSPDPTTSPVRQVTPSSPHQSAMHPGSAPKFFGSRSRVPEDLNQPARSGWP